MMRTASVILCLCLLAILVAPSITQAAISANTAIEVRPGTGASTNGGAFMPGSTGTDMSVYDNKNAASCTSCQSATVNISTTDAVANGTTTITSATGNFSSALVNNIVYFTGGTGSIAAVRRQVLTFTNSTTIVLDASIASSTGMTMNIGGALDSIDTALLFNLAQNTIWVKSTATITRTTTLTLNNAGSPLSYNTLLGYTTTRGDHGPVTLSMSTNTGFAGITGTTGWWVDGFSINCNSLGTSTGFTMGQQSLLSNSKIANCTTRLLNLVGSNDTIIDNEFTGCSSACTAGLTIPGNSTVERNYIHDNASLCVDLSQTGITFAYNVIANCTGVNTDGVKADFAVGIEHNTFYNIGRDALTFLGSSGHIFLGTGIRNNVFDTAGRYCINGASVSLPASPAFDGNFFFGCVTANRLNIDATTASYVYTNVHDVQLTASPLTGPGAGNYNLNSTTGGGALVKAAGTPGTLPGATGTGYPDGGAFQSQAPTGGTASAFVQ